MKAKYLVIDTETTGVHAYENGLIQLACLALDSHMEVLAEFDCLVKPPDGTVYTEESVRIHGITEEELIHAVSYRELLQQFLYFIKENFNDRPILIAQFLPFDYSFLDAVFGKVAPEVPIFQMILSRDFIDTKSLANVFNLKAEIDGKPTYFLETSLSKTAGLKETLGLDIEAYKSHNALSDCYATRDVLIKMLDLFEVKSYERNLNIDPHQTPAEVAINK